jgi:hypothetical protein
VTAAVQEMRSVKIPTYLLDIFHGETLALAKAIFSNKLREETSGGTIFFLKMKLLPTLESYFVDKHLSSRIPTQFMHSLIPIIEKGVLSEHKLFEEESEAFSCDRKGYFIGAIQHSPEKMGYHLCTELQIETSFMVRVAERVRKQVEVQILNELPSPHFESKQATQVFKGSAQEVKDGFNFVSNVRNNGDLTGEDHLTFNAYCKQFFDERNRRMVEIFKAAWEKDKALREKDPNAPLLNLVTIDHFENKIWQKRKELYIKTAATIVTLALFFFITISLPLAAPAS